MFTLELYNRKITEFYFRSGLNAFIVEYTKNTSELNEGITANARKYQNRFL